MHKQILRLAVPAILTNITVPLLGIVDLAIAGHTPSPGGAAVVLGAISVGGLIFNMVYWIFNFLRISSSGLTAQAYGSNNPAAQRQVLRLGVKIGLIAGLAIILLQWPILQVAHILIAPTDGVWQLASTYYNIRVWGAPAVLCLFAVNGWLIGMQNAVYPMWLAIFQNLTNILLSACFVFVFGMGIAGIALGTLLSQWLGVLFIGALMFRKYRFVFGRTDNTESAPGIPLSRYFQTNLDIFFRMLLMIVVTCSVTAIGARQGDTLLAVNTLLMQFFTLFSYFSDGFAAAGEALSGRFYGARQPVLLRTAVRQLFLWAFLIAVVFTAVYAFGGMSLLGLLTDDISLLPAVSTYLPWGIAIPVASFATFAWDGIYIGLTATRQMLWSIVWATVLFFAVFFLPNLLSSLFTPEWRFFTLHSEGFGAAWEVPLKGDLEGPIFTLNSSLLTDPNHRLWLAFIIYLVVRSVAQTLMAPRLLRLTE